MLGEVFSLLELTSAEVAAKAEADKQFSAAVGALNALRSMLIQPQLDAQFAAHHRGRHTHQAYRR